MDALDAFAGKCSNLLSKKALEKRIPLSGTFELLPYCNMNCKMCYIVHQHVEKERNQLKDIDFWKEQFNQAIEQGMLYSLITGGEPFIYPQFKELMEWLSQKPIHIALNTNGTLLDRRNVEWLADVHPGRLNISLYGGSNETYSRLCQNPKGYTQIIQAFELLNEYDIPFRVHTTLTPDNYQDYEEIVAICNHYQVPLQMAYYMFPPYRKDYGVITNEARFTPKQASEVALRILLDRNPNPIQRRIQLEANCACFQEPHRYSLFGDRTVSCRGGYASFWIDWRGRVSGCGIHTVEQIDLTKTAFSDAWKQIVISTEQIKISEKCSNCKYRCICPVCVAAAYCETGDMGNSPEYLCEFSENYAYLLQEELERLKNGSLQNIL